MMMILIMMMMLMTMMILLSWQHPEEPNGKIFQYTVYIKELGRAKSQSPKSYKVNNIQMNYHATSLNKKSRYEFWVTAHTTIGEGQPSSKVTLSPSSRVPAKIASFDEKFVVAAKKDVKMPCIAVGSPSPTIKWKIKEQDFVKSERIRYKITIILQHVTIVQCNNVPGCCLTEVFRSLT